MLETLLKVILWASFELFRRIFSYVTASQKRRPFNSHCSLGNGWKSVGARSVENGGWPSVATLLFVGKSLTKTDRCAGALTWRRNQLMVLHFSGRFLLTAPLRRQRMSMHNPLFTVLQKFPSCSNSCTSYQRIPGKFSGVKADLHTHKPRLKFEERNQLHALAILLPGKTPSSI